MTRDRRKRTGTAELGGLIALLGDDATLALIQAHAGTRMYVPQLERTHLVALMGEVATDALVKKLGSNYLKVPIAREWRVLAYRAQGRSYAEIARLCGCSEGNVWRILHEHELTASQLDLFERA
ncbi:sigma factor-like helix-turn-helix DNA-binding protein [Xanthobacter sp. DSM 24535]|uniref:sigma factor-like helix-turn-helix DNA-binding protein n=1 Tax=Roseixanthobacter psychrophilus TaxID=3119917 RepID=UPI003726DB45